MWKRTVGTCDQAIISHIVPCYTHNHERLAHNVGVHIVKIAQE